MNRVDLLLFGVCESFNVSLNVYYIYTHYEVTILKVQNFKRIFVLCLKLISGLLFCVLVQKNESLVYLTHVYCHDPTSKTDETL